MSRPSLLNAVAEIQPLWEHAMKHGYMREDFPLEDLFAAAASAHTKDEPPKLRMSYGKNCMLEKWFVHHLPHLAPKRGLGRMMHTDGNTFEAIAIGCLEYALDQTEDWSFARSWMQKELVMPGDPNIKGHTDGAIYYKGKPYAIVDPKKTKYYAHVWWTPVPMLNEKGRPGKPQFGDCVFPPEKWGYRHQAGNYIAASGLDFMGFMWLVGFRDDESLSIGFADRVEVEQYHAQAKQSFAAAQQSSPPPPCVEDRGSTPCRQWFSKKAGTYKSYCDFLEPCLELMENRQQFLRNNRIPV